MRTVALVDDQEDFLFLVARYLKAWYRVACFSRAETAAEGIEALGPDLVILDAHMPEVSGYEIRRRLRAQPRFAALPILFLSGSAFEEEGLGSETGATRFLLKPIEPEDLLRAVREILGDAPPRAES